MTEPIKKSTLWTGRILSGLPILMMLFSAVMKFSHSEEMLKNFVDKFGYPEKLLTPIGAIEVVCVIIYAIPKTSVLGAILVTAYLGGAVATHVRIGDIMFIPPVVFGILVWGGLYFRDPRIRALIPFNCKNDND